MTRNKNHKNNSVLVGGFNQFARELTLFAASYKLASDQETFNICESCMEKTGFQRAEHRVELSDFGVCARCHDVTDVYDLELLALYRAFGLSNAQIAANLPLLRKAFGHSATLQEKQILEMVSSELPNVILNSLETEGKD